MEQQSSLKDKLNIKAICVCGLLCAVAVCAVGVSAVRVFIAGVEECRYTEYRENLMGASMRYLTASYRDNGHYPDSLDFNQFPVPTNDRYREMVDDIEYRTDGNEFEILWRTPARVEDTTSEVGKLRIWRIQGRSGEPPDYEVNVRQKPPAVRLRRAGAGG
jgi:hypothetical protein